MRGWIIVHRLPRGASDAERVAFRQRFLGATTTSHGGKYKSHREGLLERIPHRRIMPGVVLVGREAREEVEGFLREQGVDHWTWEVVLREDDLRYLTSPPHG